jgi:hypothetical protein
LEHVYNALEVDLHWPQPRLDDNLGDWLSDKAKPAAAEVVDDEAKPHHAVKLFNWHLQLDRDADEGDVSGGYFNTDLSPEWKVGINYKLSLLTEELFYPNDLWRLAWQLKVLDIDLGKTFIVFFIQGNVNFFCDGGFKELALRPFGVSYKQKAVKESLILFWKQIASLKSVLVFVWDVFSYVYFGHI